MRNTRKSGQILRSKRRSRPTLRSGKGNRTNSNTSHQIPARVIEDPTGRSGGRDHSPLANNMTEALASKTCTPCRGTARFHAIRSYIFGVVLMMVIQRIISSLFWRYLDAKHKHTLQSGLEYEHRHGTI